MSGVFPAIPATALPAMLQALAPNGFCPLSSGFDACDPAVNFAAGGSCFQQSPVLACLCIEAATGGKCEFSDSGLESFSISTNATTGAQTFTITASNDYYSVVNGSTLPAVADIITPTASRNWDCSTTGKTVVAIDASAVDFTACDSKMEKGLDSSDHDSCQQQETSGKSAEGGQQMQ